MNESRRRFLRSTFEVPAVETAASVPTLGRATTGSFASALIASRFVSLHGDRVSPSSSTYWRRQAASDTRSRVPRLVVTHAFYDRYWARNFAYTPVRGVEAFRVAGIAVRGQSIAPRVAVLM